MGLVGFLWKLIIIQMYKNQSPLSWISDDNTHYRCRCACLCVCACACGGQIKKSQSRKLSSVFIFCLNGFNFLCATSITHGQAIYIPSIYTCYCALLLRYCFILLSIVTVCSSLLMADFLCVFFFEKKNFIVYNNTSTYNLDGFCFVFNE